MTSKRGPTERFPEKKEYLEINGSKENPYSKKIILKMRNFYGNPGKLRILGRSNKI